MSVLVKLLVKSFNVLAALIQLPSLMPLRPNNWYRGQAPLKKPNNFGKIQKKGIESYKHRRQPVEAEKVISELKKKLRMSIDKKDCRRGKRSCRGSLKGCKGSSKHS